MKRFTLLLILGVVLLLACQKSDSKAIAVVSKVCDTSQVSYKNDIVPIINKYCNSCHGGENPNVGSIDFSKYDQIAPLAADSPNYIYNVVCYNSKFKKTKSILYRFV
jgi:hypothetical protein